LSDGCVGCAVGGVFDLEACGTVCVALMGSSSEGIVSYLVGVCCFPYARLGWRCGAMAARELCGRQRCPLARTVGSVASVLWPMYSVLSSSCSTCVLSIAVGWALCVVCLDVVKVSVCMVMLRGGECV
jgi:hypothetical protein